MLAGGVNWTKVEDGENNEYQARIAGKLVTVFSDREGDMWNCYFDDEEMFSLEADYLGDALREAAKEAREAG